MNRLTRAIVLWIVLAMASGLGPMVGYDVPTASAQSITQDRVDALINNFGSNDPAVRDAASADLIRAANASIANARLIDTELRRIGLTSADLEVRLRSKEALMNDESIRVTDKRCEVQPDGNYVITLDFRAFAADGIRTLDALLFQTNDPTEEPEVVTIRRLFQNHPPKEQTVTTTLKRSSCPMRLQVRVTGTTGGTFTIDPPFFHVTH